MSRSNLFNPTAQAVISTALPLAATTFILANRRENDPLDDALKSLMGVATSLPYISAIIGAAGQHTPACDLPEKAHLGTHLFANIAGMGPAVSMMLYGAAVAVQSGDHSDMAILKTAAVGSFALSTLMNIVYLIARLCGLKSIPQFELAAALPGFIGSIGFLALNAMALQQTLQTDAKTGETASALMIVTAAAFTVFTGYLCARAIHAIKTAPRAAEAIASPDDAPVSINTSAMTDSLGAPLLLEENATNAFVSEGSSSDSESEEATNTFASPKM